MRVTLKQIATKMLALKVEHPRKRLDARVLPSVFVVGQTAAGT